MKFSIDFETVPQELRAGLAHLSEEYPVQKTTGELQVHFKADSTLMSGGSKVIFPKDKITVNYGRKIDAFRALGRIMGGTHRDYVEKSFFNTLGIMIDCSRNGVLTVDSVKMWLRRCALMGINMVMLYTEDTYIVDGEPYFGYLRGAYSYSELKEMDDYAYALGIEMIPCIQALGHMEQVLQWNYYKDVKDTRDILLVGEKKTYQLLEKMITSASSPFRSKRIHIGMDEAHGLGTGEYKKRNGERSSFDIINEHLAHVLKICRKNKLNPMIWSDMYFRIGSKTNDYYDKDSIIPQNVIKNIPKDVNLVYWDYYHKDYDFYAEWIDRHRELGSEPIVATGIWTWKCFWLHYKYSKTSIEPCMKACKSKGVSEVFATMWGDDGMECDTFSALPGVQYFAEHGYNEEVDLNQLQINFRGSCGGSFNNWLAASGLDNPSIDDLPEAENTNVSKWLLWDDPFIGLCRPQLGDTSLKEYYAVLADKLFKYSESSDLLGERLAHPAQLAKVISLKCDLQPMLISAYSINDKTALNRLATKDIPQLLTETRRLWQSHRDMWLKTYKPFGLEVIELRYGGLILRMESLIQRLTDYIAGKIKSIPEFEVKRFPAFDNENKLPNISKHRRIFTSTDLV